jgi:hypothetical protein
MRAKTKKKHGMGKRFAIVIGVVSNPDDETSDTARCLRQRPSPRCRTQGNRRGAEELEQHVGCLAEGVGRRERRLVHLGSAQRGRFSSKAVLMSPAARRLRPACAEHSLMRRKTKYGAVVAVLLLRYLSEPMPVNR